MGWVRKRPLMTMAGCMGFALETAGRSQRLAGRSSGLVHDLVSLRPLRSRYRAPATVPLLNRLAQAEWNAMHANIGALPEDAAPVAKRREWLISIPYLFLRGSTAGAALAMGFVQTFVLARVLSPERFSIFIVIGAVGYSLWVTDLGLAKILFVNLRDRHLAGRSDEHAARQATAVILLYGLLAGGASLACFAITLIHPASTVRSAAELSL